MTPPSILQAHGNPTVAVRRSLGRGTVVLERHRVIEVTQQPSLVFGCRPAAFLVNVFSGERAGEPIHFLSLMREGGRQWPPLRCMDLSFEQVDQ